MLFRKSALALAVLPLASGFVAQPIGGAARLPTTSIAATVEKELTPPRDLDELTKEMAGAQDLYNAHVQKTYGRYPLTMASGKGCRLTTNDGTEYLDFVSGIATCCLGHANQDLIDAVNKQMQQVHHVSNLYYIPAQAALATWLTDNSCADKVFFCNSGAESNEAAIKLARRHASNQGITHPVIITAHQSFHGRSLAALTATAQPKYHKGFGFGGEMVQGFEYVTYNSVEELEAMVEKIVANQPAEGKQGLAAIMMEPLQGEGGIKPGTKEFFQKARELCDKHGALLMCDEVQVGMGRSGTLWGHQQLDIEPDVFTSAKALGGGVPIGAMMARGEAADVFGPGDHASTYGGNALACAAGVAVAKYFTEHDVLGNVRARGQQLSDGLAAIAKKYPTVLGEVRGWGLLKGIQTMSDDIPAGNLVQAAMDQGLLLVAAGPSVVRFVPPLIVTEAEINEALEKFEKAVNKLAN